MPGGLMNLVSEGQGNVILNGNPTKTFFKTTYAKYTNFGIQKFRIDYEGSKSLRLSEESTFDFKILRYADLLMDTYISVTLPDIWSPIVPPPKKPGKWVPYEFKWIENLGFKMISKLVITCGNQKLFQCSGDYLLASAQRDMALAKYNLVNYMTGNIPQYTDPASYGMNKGNYPNAYYYDSSTTPEPSIRGRVIYIPLNVWFVLSSNMAFPLVSLQYNELHIYVTFRPINQLFTIRDVYDSENSYPRVAPDFNTYYMQMYRFLQPPPDTTLGINSYTDKRSIWNTDVNLVCSYCFLSNEEQRVFALKEQNYLIKQVNETIHYNVTGSNKIDLNCTSGMVTSWMFYFQRSDVNLRNEWSNYTNFPYSSPPNFISPAPIVGSEPFYFLDSSTTSSIGPGINTNNTLTNLFITKTYSIENTKDILIDLSILFDGEYRENTQPSGVYNYLEKYIKTPSFITGSLGLYCYNFNLETASISPSGAINISRFNNIQFEFNTIIPPLDLLAQSMDICDPSTGQVIGVNKPYWNIYQYNFNIYLFEEKYNILKFSGGNAGLLWAY